MPLLRFDFEYIYMKGSTFTKISAISEAYYQTLEIIIYAQFMHCNISIERKCISKMCYLI